jgi:hypothetical protein
VQVISLIVVLWQGGGIDSVAIVVGVVSTLIGPITFYIAILPYGAGWRKVGEVLYRPIVCGVISIGMAWLIALKMDARGFGPVPQFIETVVVGVALNVLLAWLWMRPVWDDFWLRVRRILPQQAEA